MGKPAEIVLSPWARIVVERISHAKLWPWGILIEDRDLILARHRTKKAALAHASRIRRAIG